PGSGGPRPGTPVKPAKPVEPCPLARPPGVPLVFLVLLVALAGGLREGGPVAVLVLGGAHDLSASVRAVAPGAEYLRVTTRRYREASGQAGGLVAGLGPCERPRPTAGSRAS